MHSMSLNLKLVNQYIEGIPIVPTHPITRTYSRLTLWSESSSGTGKSKESGDGLHVRYCCVRSLMSAVYDDNE